MSSNKKTTYYNLSQFQDSDKPTWRGDYNGDMAKIDTGIRDASVKATDARTAADNAATTANTAKTTANTAKTTADNAATVAATAKTTADNAKTAADNATKTANTASSTANTASTTASSANATANTANTTANSANTTANAAKTAADTAKTRADAAAAKAGVDLNSIVWIGDSYSTGYQPNGNPIAQDNRIPYVTKTALAADGITNLYLYANNASGYNKQGDGNKTFRTLLNEAVNNNAINKTRVKYVVFAGGRNDSPGVQETATELYTTAKQTYPNAQIHVFFLFNNGAGNTSSAQVMEQLQNAAHEVDAVAFHPFAWTWGLTHLDWFAGSNDIHPNAVGAKKYGECIATALMGREEPAGNAAGTCTLTGNFSGQINWAVNAGIATISGKFSVTKAEGDVANLPACFDLDDGFILALTGAGKNITYLHLDNGDLNWTGSMTNATNTGNAWIPPVSFSLMGGSRQN